jgi:hypothetical protein
VTDGPSPNVSSNLVWVPIGADIGNEREKLKITNPGEANAGDGFSDHLENQFDRQLARCLLERCRFIAAKWTYTETIETQSSNENREVE